MNFDCDEKRFTGPSVNIGNMPSLKPFIIFIGQILSCSEVDVKMNAANYVRLQAC